MQDEFRECRLYRHAWKEYQCEDPKFAGATWRHSLHLRCLRCGMLRHDAFNRDMTFLNRRYEPPEGYYLDKGEERPEVEQLRLWAVKRQRRLSAGQANRADQDTRARRAAADAL